MTPDGLSFGLIGGALELRANGDGAKRLRGSFPYRKRAVISDGGRGRRPEKEEFEENAFEFRVKDPDAEIHLLSGHRFDKPLASKIAGTLTLKDTAPALLFDALITRDVAETSHARDVLALLAAGLATGISPGFRMPPERAVAKEDAEEFIDEPLRPEDGMFGARIRRIKQALLFELSIVTAPAYPDAQVEVRNRKPPPSAFLRPSLAFSRWRP
ncbi:MAG: HK97 family phage prohead protease [Hyphomonadaceae bacterium]|nr:HK97 family phage prohead protease [Hyphomonadaceae bacterium]MBY0423820.1 HK97 family phage prohead protease [Parvularculaceae bacterium]